MDNTKTVRFFKIAGCASVYVLFVVIMFNVNIQNNTVLVLVSTLVGSVVVVASYHEYRGTLLHIPSKSKSKAKSSFVEPRAILQTEPAPAPEDLQAPAAGNYDDGLPTFDLAMFEPEVLKRVTDLRVDDDVQDEILNALKDIPPEQRLKYIDDIFQANVDFDAAY
ncbi:MAG: hypothetical protein JW839_05805 [Candidatus Lokiarchaeota archaeon]|nr:hypothetical protein [Candidatus Lokiarchaeota archaeon]